MPLNSEILPTETREEFCLALKAARERKRITLEAIAEATKIPAFLFAALERNDLRRWPKGLFRRSFFRDYATMIGLPVTEACAQFARLFPDEETAALATPASVNEPAQSEECRLVLDAAWHGAQGPMAPRFIAALIDAGVVVFAALALSLLAGVDAGLATAGVALSYFSIATMVLGESPARWAIRHWSLLDSPAAPEPVDESDSRDWVTDAYRVAPEPRLRVRIKVS